MQPLLSILGVLVCLQTAPGQTAPAQPRPDAAAPAGYHLAPGPFTPSSASLELKDERRHVLLPVLVRFPEKAAGPVPLIIFSHGMGGSSEAFADVTAHWASQGYVVILPTHADSVKRQDPSARAEFLKNPSAYMKKVDPEGRVDDVKLILDSLDLIESKIPGLTLAGGAKLIDRERVGMAGHSAGALTTQMIFGAKVRTRGALRLHSVGDPRIDAAIVISGQGTTSRVLSEDSWDELRKPMLVITGSLDTAAVGNETPESRQDPYRHAPAGDKYLLFIEGATHSSYQGKGKGGRIGQFVDRAGPTTDLSIIGDAVKSQTLAFWDAYLKHSAEAKAYLSADAVKAIDKAVKAEHK